MKGVRIGLVAVALVAVFVAMSCVAGCRSSNNAGPVSDWLVVVMRNTSADLIHMFVTPGEGFDPANRIAAGGSRVYRVQRNGNTQFTVSAGRNGVVLDTSTDTARDGRDGFTATWNGTALTLASD